MFRRQSHTGHRSSLGQRQMAHGWVKSGMRGLRSSGAGFLHVSPAVVGPTAYRNPLCTTARAPATTAAVPTSPLLVFTQVRKVDGCYSARGLATLGAVRCTSGAVQLRRMHSAFAPPFSAPEASLRQVHVVGRHPSGLAAWSRFSTSSDTTPKEPPESSGDEGVGGIPASEADVAEVVEPTPTEEPRHAHIEMPSITDVGVQTDCFPGQCVTLIHVLICCCF